MLDLKKLATKLDNALSTETVESLSTWLSEKRKKAAYQDSVGNGSYSSLTSIETIIEQKPTTAKRYRFMPNELSSGSIDQPLTKFAA